jgi:hypothetical protein
MGEGCSRVEKKGEGVNLSVPGFSLVLFSRNEAVTTRARGIRITSRRSTPPRRRDNRATFFLIFFFHGHDGYILLFMIQLSR